MDEHEAAVAAHWMLGRLTVVQATVAHLQGNDDLDPESRDLLLARSREVMSQLQRVIEDMARGLPPLSLELRRQSPISIAV